MCPPDDHNDETESGSRGKGSESGQGKSRNRVVDRLTDEELKAGGMKRAVVYVREKRSKGSVRQEKHRDKQEKNGKRQFNVVMPDDEGLRATVRATAAAIEDEKCHQAVEGLLANEDLRSFAADAAARPELCELINLVRPKEGVPPDKGDQLLAILKILRDNPDLVSLVKRIARSRRFRNAITMAAANPAFVLLGEIIATRRGVCVRLARLLFRVRQRHASAHH